MAGKSALWVSTFVIRTARRICRGRPRASPSQNKVLHCEVTFFILGRVGGENRQSILANRLVIFLSHVYLFISHIPEIRIRYFHSTEGIRNAEVAYRDH